MKLQELVAYLDDYLRLGTVKDFDGAWNGLQVEGTREVSRVAVAVDACQAVIDRAAVDADLLIVHHGLFWDGLLPLTGRHYRKVTALLARGVALYSAHLPLDVHPEVGNNTLLARLIGMPVTRWWGDAFGSPIGVRGELPLSRAALGERLASALGVVPKIIPGGPDRAGTVGIVTGAGGSLIEAAHREGLDTFVTGEGKHSSYFDAEELGINVIYAGHYATETLGVRALGEHLARTFGVTSSFIDHPTGM